MSGMTLTGWKRKHKRNIQEKEAGIVYLFADEFTNYNESDIGIKTILLLEKLGYNVVIPKHIESGRTFLSKGLLKAAKKTVDRNILMLRGIITEESPMVGIEPSAILTFRDEYPELADAGLIDDAKNLSRNALMLEEFICREFEKGKIRPEMFTVQSRHILLHGHCQQKAISSTDFTKRMLSIPANYKVRSAAADAIIAAPGTSCRNQIADGTGRKALHPVEIMYDALKTE
jgi:Fe-S oxidoreductase